MSNKYETLLLFSPELGAEGRQEALDNFSSIISTQGGEVKEVDDWGARNLAYPVKKQTRGHYVRLEYFMPPLAVAELERNIRITDGMFKYVTVRLDEEREDA